MNDELELLIAKRLRVKSPPAGWLLRAPWNAGPRRTRRTIAHIHKFDYERRAGGRRPARARLTRLLGLLEAGRAPSECERRGGGSVDDGEVEGKRYEFLVELRLDVRHPEPGPQTRLRAARLFVAVAVARLLPDKRHEAHVEQRVARLLRFGALIMQYDEQKRFERRSATGRQHQRVHCVVQRVAEQLPHLEHTTDT